MAEVISNERHFGAQLTAGQSCAPGVLMYITSAGTASVADLSTTKWARGVALTSGSGTKVAGISQYVRLDRCARVVLDANDSQADTLTIGSAVYLGEDGGYLTSGTQRVGIALAADEVFVDLDLHDDDS